MEYTLSKEIQKRLSKEEYYNQDDFIKDCNSYIQAVRSGRTRYQVLSVTRSGMSRNISIISFEGTMGQGYYRQYNQMLKMLGYNISINNTIKVSGCGMDMVFATNYNLMHSFKRMGLITKEDCDILAQKING